MEFQWDKIQFKPDGKVFLLYRHERIFDEGLIKPGDSVIDVGGWGVLAERIRQEGAYCTIFDKFTKDQYYPERVSANDHIKGDILNDNLTRIIHNVDVITCFEMLEHCGDIRKAIKNMWHMLKIGGIFVGTVPIPGHSHDADQEDVQFLTSVELNILLGEAGFTNILVEPTASINKEEPAVSLYFRATKII
jgi:2-polyprenyl-3-methyl-5-hydroxy-6-metoxy-1,4-benzoquinol methylase